MSLTGRDSTDFIESFFFEEEVSDDSQLFPDLSVQDRHELEETGNVFETPASSPLSDSFDMNYPQMTIRSEQIRSRRDSTDFIESFFFEEEVSDDSQLFPNLSVQDRHELEETGNIFETPASSPLSDSFDMNYPQMTIRSEQRRSRRDIYGTGFEHQKLQSMPHFGQPFRHLRFFIQLGSPKLSWFKTIGKMYNEHFHKEIALRQIPKFSRNHSRRLDLAYFFIDDQKSIILPWLKEIGQVSPDF